MFDLIIEKLPDLQRLEATASDLEGKHGQAQARVQALALRTAQAREDDLNREAAALNSGRKVPNASEPGLREQLEGAGRDAEVLGRRLALANNDRALYLAENHELLLGLLGEAHASEGERVAAAAGDALEALLALFRCEDDARGLQRLHPAPQEENWGGPESVSVVWGNLTTVNVGGVNRGALEGTLRQLISLGAPTIVEAGAQDDDEDAA